MGIDGISKSAGNAARQAAERVAVEQKQTALVQNTVATKPAAQNTVATKPAAPAQPVDVFEAKSTEPVKTAQVDTDPNGKKLPAIPSNTHTVQAGTATLGDDDNAKRARGAIKIEEGPGFDPKKYDGMYIGSDKYAYPPDKFSISEVPPFKPNEGKAIANPPPTTYYVNGIDTQPLGVDHAQGEAEKLANKTGTNVVLIYNATEGVTKDVIQTGMDRLNVGNNKATETLANAIYKDLNEGKQVNVAGYSQGGAIVSSALRDVDERIKNDNGGFWGNLPVFGDDNRKKREALLGNVNVTSIAGAGKTFPDGPRYNFYVNNQDPVPTWLGSHDFNAATDIGSAIVSGIPWAGAINGGSSIQWPRGAKIHTFDTNGSDSNILSVNGKHGFNTYLSNIQDPKP